MQENHDRHDQGHDAEDLHDHIKTIHSKKGHRLSHSAKKFLKGVRQDLDQEIHEIQN
jgi:hypothetical protein